MSKVEKKSELSVDSLAVHGHDQDVFPGESDVASAIHLSTIYRRAPDGSYPEGYSYSRVSNPNRAALEQTLSALEGGSSAACFGSGSAAVTAVFQALATGDRVVVAHDTYHGTPAILSAIMARWGLQVEYVDMSDHDAVKAALAAPTRLVWIETPSNPMMRVTDIAAVVEMAKAANAAVVADNTVATPILQKPLQLGCDMVVHSTTKYIGGHSDVLGGAVITRSDSALFENVRTIQCLGGGVPSAFDCWLMLRGVKTLPQRVRAQSANALRLAQHLSEHPNVEAVHYPGLETHPRHALAARQMQAFGGLLSFQVRGGAKEAFAMVARLALITRATSLGSVESTIEHRASMEHPATKTPQNLLRMSVGIEAVDDLWRDLRSALAD